MRFRLIEQTNGMSLSSLLLTVLQRGMEILSPHILRRIPRVIALAATAGINSLEFSELLKHLRAPSPLTISLLQALNEMNAQVSNVFHCPPPAFFVFDGQETGLRSDKIPVSCLSKDLHVCFWFRIEDVFHEDHEHNRNDLRQCLFRLIDVKENGIGIFVKGKALMVSFSNDSGKLEEVMIPEYIVSPGHWCHLSACFIKPKYMLYKKDELRITIDNQCLLLQKVNFYRSTKEGEGSGALSLRIGFNMRGEMGPLFIFPEIITSEAVDAVSGFRTGNFVGVRGPGALNVDLESELISTGAESGAFAVGSKTTGSIPAPLAVYSPLRYIHR